MAELITFSTAAKLLTALVLGAMVFFAAVVAPTVFRALPEDMAGRFLRALFPLYYRVLALTVGTAAFATAIAGPGWTAIALFIVAALFILGLFVLTPRINAARDAWIAGDRTARKRFGQLHTLSVMINLFQLVAVLIVFLALTS